MLTKYKGKPSSKKCPTSLKDVLVEKIKAHILNKEEEEDNYKRMVLRNIQIL